MDRVLSRSGFRRAVLKLNVMALAVTILAVVPLPPPG